MFFNGVDLNFLSLLLPSKHIDTGEDWKTAISRNLIYFTFEEERQTWNLILRFDRIKSSREI